MRIAIATCSDLPGWEVDDAPLFEALTRRDIDFDLAVWDDPNVDWSTYKGVLIRTTWDYTDKFEEFVRWADHVDQVSRLFNPGRVIRWNTHKTYLRDLESVGVPIAPTVWLDRGSTPNIQTCLAERGWERAFIKPMVGATARETLRFSATPHDIERAQAHVDRLLPHEGLMLQPYLKYVETRGERTAVFVDGRITHTVEKIPVKGDYRVQDDFGAYDGPTEFTPEEMAIARCAVAEAERRPEVSCKLLYARVDFLLDESGSPVLNELELVEPSLFLRHGLHAADALAEALIKRLRL